MNIKLRNKTRRRNISRMSLRSNSKSGGSPKEINELMSQEFVDTMRENMWQFINPDTIIFVLEAAGCSTTTSIQKNINSNIFTEQHKNTICFKGDLEEGHYVYICPKGRVTGTYENDLLCSEDDGICHGAALAAALNQCGYDMGRIVKNPKSIKGKKTNYRTIMNTYLFIINQGWWDKALSRNFGKEVHWNRAMGSYKETLEAKNILTDFLLTL